MARGSKKKEQAKPEAAAQAEKTEEKPKPERVIWRGKGEPPSEVRIGMLEIKGLPDAAAQKAGFEHENARELVTNVQGYKLLKEKGE